MDIFTPEMIWDGFSPYGFEPELDMLSVTRNGGAARYEFYFSPFYAGGFWAAEHPSHRTRIYCVFTKPDGNEARPVILIAGDPTAPAGGADYQSEFLSEYCLRKGYAVLKVDLRGNGGNPPDRTTFYAPEQARADFTLNPDIYACSGEPRDNCWYIWSAVCSRALSALKCIDSGFENVGAGFIGIGIAASAGVITAAIDSRVTALAALFLNEPAFKDGDESSRYFGTAFSAKTYAPKLKCPVFFGISSNAPRQGSLGRAVDAFFRTPQRLGSFISVSALAADEIGYGERNNLDYFFRAALFHSAAQPPMPPKIAGAASGEKLYFTVEADNPENAEEYTLWYAYGGKTRTRSWERASMTAVGENSHAAYIDAYDTQERIFAFASVRYKNGLTLSSRMLAKTAAGYRAKVKRFVKNRLLYSSEGNWRGTLTTVKNGRLIHYSDNVSAVEGPLGIIGARAEFGCLATYRAGDARFKAEPGLLLQVSLYSPEDGVLNVGLSDDYGAEYVSRDVAFKGGGNWQKIVLEPADFKADDVPVMSDFTSVSSIYFKTDKPVTVCNIIWI